MAAAGGTRGGLGQESAQETLPLPRGRFLSCGEQCPGCQHEGSLFLSLAGHHREQRSVALPQRLRTLQLSHGPPAGWEPLARPCLSFPPAMEHRGRRPGRYPQLVPARGGSPWWVFPLADAEQSSSPRTDIGSDQEDSKPIMLGECRAGVRGRPNPPAASLQRRHPLGRQLCPRAGSSRPQLWCPPSPGKPLPGTCNELGTASASAHSSRPASHRGRVPWGQQLPWGSRGVAAAPSPASALSCRETEARSSPGGSLAEGPVRVVLCWRREAE